MSIIQNSKIDSFEGGEGVKIKEYFNPNNTSNQINYSIAKCSLDVGKKTKLHKIKFSISFQLTFSVVFILIIKIKKELNY